MRIKKLLAVCVLALAPTLALSLPLQIIEMPLDNTSGANELLRHNLFHTADSAGGTLGAEVAWFDLDTSMVSTWDPVTGALDLHVLIFQEDDLTVPLGTAHATGNLLFSGVGPEGLLGTITWDFNTIVGGILANPITTSYYNFAYGDDTAGYVGNSLDGNVVTLWGADGDYIGNGDFDTTNGLTTLGVDMQFIVAAPEPSILVLMAIGLIGFGASTRKKH